MASLIGDPQGRSPYWICVCSASEGGKTKRIWKTTKVRVKPLKALKRYLQESGETERAVAARIGINRHNLDSWLSDKQSPKKGKLALTAFFLRRVGYL